MGVTDTGFLSCAAIRTGFNFYRSGKVTACCHGIDPALEIARVDDPALPQRILAFQSAFGKLHRQGAAPAVCHRCTNFQRDQWPAHLGQPFAIITLNHYRACNLRCVHCGYRRNDEQERDTPHELVLKAIKRCIAAGICVRQPHLGVGGGEPSLAPGMTDILRHALDHGWTADINSNGARFQPLYAEGVNAGVFALWLTPDAGSREVYARIKGADCFDATWRTIARYMEATGARAVVKFIIEAGNRDDVPAMISTAAAHGVRHLALSLDFGIPPARHEEYREPVALFVRLAGEAGLKIVADFLPVSLRPAALNQR